MKNSVQIYLNLLLLIFCLLFYGCNAAPSQSTVKDIIVQHFEARYYNVKNIDIGKIRPMPMGEKQYMGTPGFDVDVVSIVLISQEDKGESSSYKNGQEMIFNKATIRIKQRTGPDKEWVIANISGIAIP